MARVDRSESALVTQNVKTQRVAVRSIAWLDDSREFMVRVEREMTNTRQLSKSVSSCERSANTAPL